MALLLVDCCVEMLFLTGVVCTGVYVVSCCVVVVIISFLCTGNVVLEQSAPLVFMTENHGYCRTSLYCSMKKDPSPIKSPSKWDVMTRPPLEERDERSTKGL